MMENFIWIKDCRDCFMAHTLANEEIRKSGVKTQLVLDLLFKIADFVERLHKEICAENINAHKAYDDYCEIAPRTWDAFLSQYLKEV